MKENRTTHNRKYSNTTLTPVSPRPKTEYNVETKNTHAQLSKPWSNSSPSGVLEFVLRACLPSTPSAYTHTTTYISKTNMQVYTQISHTNTFPILLPHSHNVSEVLWILDNVHSSSLKNLSVNKQASTNLHKQMCLLWPYYGQFFLF